MLPSIRMAVSGSVARELDALEDAIEDEMEAVFARGGQRVAEHARSNHPFQNRTGQLEASIHAARPRGRFMRGTMEAEISARMPYASFVELGTARARAYRFMVPALDASRDFIENDAMGAVERAVARARG